MSHSRFQIHANSHSELAIRQKYRNLKIGNRLLKIRRAFSFDNQQSRINNYQSYLKSYFTHASHKDPTSNVAIVIGTPTRR
jgi:hypothetical protein